MCLTKINEIIKNKSGIGYKVFQMDGCFIHSLVEGCPYNYFTNRWLDEYHYRKRKNIASIKIESIEDGKKRYPTGFHIFLKLKDAKTLERYLNKIYPLAPYKTFKVKYKEAVVDGVQNFKLLDESLCDMKSIVVKKMLIMK